MFEHLAWGYVDQPPFVAFAAWLAAPAGYSLLALRAFPILAAALTVFVAVLLTAELGGGRFAQWLCGIATLLMPAYLLLGNALTTTSFEPFFWTLATSSRCALCATRAARAAVVDSPRLRQRWALRKIFDAPAGRRHRERDCSATRNDGCSFRAPLYASASRAVALAEYSLAGRPRMALHRGPPRRRGSPPRARPGSPSNSAPSPATVAPLRRNNSCISRPAAPVLAGRHCRAVSTRPASRSSVDFRCVYRRRCRGVAFGAKGYYIIGIYAALLSIGAVAIERTTVWLRVALLSALTLPALRRCRCRSRFSPSTADRIRATLGLTGRDGTSPHLMQPLFAEEFGWHRLARDVAAVYFSLPPAFAPGPPFTPTRMATPARSTSSDRATVCPR